MGSTKLHSKIMEDLNNIPKESFILEEGKDQMPADTPKRVSSSPMIMIANPSNSCGLIENYDYTKNIKMYIEQEKLRMIVNASRHGITEEMIEKMLSEQNVNDFYIENIKIRLGIVDKKPERIRKPVNQTTANNNNNNNEKKPHGGSGDE